MQSRFNKKYYNTSALSANGIVFLSYTPSVRYSVSIYVPVYPIIGACATVRVAFKLSLSMEDSVDSKNLYCFISVILLWTSVVSSYTFCSWRPANLNTDSNAQLSFQCIDSPTSIIIIDNAIIGFAYNNMNGNCTNFIGCSQQVPDVAQYCTGYNSSCTLNQHALYTAPYVSQSCGENAHVNYVYVNYSCIAGKIFIVFNHSGYRR